MPAVDVDLNFLYPAVEFTADMKRHLWAAKPTLSPCTVLAELCVLAFQRGQYISHSEDALERLSPHEPGVCGFGEWYLGCLQVVEAQMVSSWC